MIYSFRKGYETPQKVQIDPKKKMETMMIITAGKTSSSFYVAAFPPGTEPSSGQIWKY